MVARMRVATGASAVAVLAAASASTAAAAVTAAVAAASADLRPVARAFTPADLPGTFTSAFKNNDACPTNVTFGDGTLNDREVYEVPWANIVENDVPCSGEGSMSFFTKAVALDPARLEAAGFPNLQAVINNSAPARTTLYTGLRQTDALIGYDGGEARTCGTTTYAADTFYFFISERGNVDITINSVKTTITPAQQGMFIASNGPVLCVLRSPKSAAIPTRAPAPSRTPAPTPAPSNPTPVATPPPVSVGGAGGGGGGGSGPTPTPSPTPTPAPTPAPTTPSAGGGGGVDPTPTPEPETPTPTPTPTPDETDGGGDEDDSPEPSDDDSECFPADAEVVLSTGATVRMDALRVGDAVATAGGRFSPVYVFTHRSANAGRSYVRLTAASGATLTATAGHYVYASGRLVAAGAVAVGDDLVLADGTPSRVVRVEGVTSSGLYNPQTLDGDIVVGGILASTYTTAVDPAVAAAALAPLRGLWAAVGVSPPQGVVSAVEGAARWAVTRLAPVVGGAASVDL